MNLIACVDLTHGIGNDGVLLVHIPEDLKRFKALTTGHTIIMGRKTLESLPGGRPLKGRDNLILSKNPDYQVENAQVFPNVEALLAATPADAFVIGGESVYRALLPYCDTAYITKVEATFNADRHFPDLDSDSEWEMTEQSEQMEQDGLAFRYLVYHRKETDNG